MFSSYVNQERTEGKTDKKQEWSTPSQKFHTLYPKGVTVQELCGVSFEPYNFKPNEEFLTSFCNDLEKMGLTNCSISRSTKSRCQHSQ